MPKILIIGATGTIGRHLVSQLLAANVKIRALVRNPDAANLPAPSKNSAATSPPPNRSPPL